MHIPEKVFGKRRCAKKMITTAIIDNNKEFSDLLFRHLKRLSENYDLKMEIHIIDSANRCLSSTKLYDLYFISIELTEIPGIELVYKLREQHIDKEFVFYSESEAEMRRAFWVKPRAFICKQHLESDLRETFDVLQHVFHNYSDRISLKDNQRSIIVTSKDMVYLHSEGHYVEIFLKSGERVVVRNTMSALLKQLQPFGFIRIHLSYLVNREYVYRYEKRKVVLKNSVSLPVSKPYQNQMLIYKK